MPDKPRKKPKHTKLALPSDRRVKAVKKTAPDRLGRKLEKTDGVTGDFSTPETKQHDFAVASEEKKQKEEKNKKKHVAFGAKNQKASPVKQQGSHAVGQNTQAATAGSTGPAVNGSDTARADFAGGSALGAMEATAGAAASTTGATEGLPPNAILMPRKKPKLSKARRRRRRRRIGFLTAVALVCAVLVVYYSGIYLNAAMGIEDLYDTATIALTPGDGYPAPFAMRGFISAEQMEAGGFAAVGAKDVSVYSQSGTVLRRIQHGYANPGLTASSTRICVYNRGGLDYTIESRSGNIARRKTEQELLFAEMSEGGWLAVVTESRYRANLSVYSPVYDATPNLQWPIVDDKPVCASFHSDNRTLALGCLSAAGGALGTTIYVLRVDSDQLFATIRADEARIVDLAYLSSNRLLAVYDTYCAVYDGKGAEVARFEYGARSLRAADTYEGETALVFGSSSLETLELVFLSNDLVPLFSAQTESDTQPRTLVTHDGVFLEMGHEVLAYNTGGVLLDARTFPQKPYALVRAPQPLLLSSTTAFLLEEMLEVKPDETSLSAAAEAGTTSETHKTEESTTDSTTAGTEPENL